MILEVATAQMSLWRHLSKDARYKCIDTTVKSGDGLLAPLWSMVTDYKKGVIDEKEYTRLFKHCMVTSFLYRNDEWIELTRPSDQILVLFCYCKAHAFCHRRLLIDYIEKVTRSLHDAPTIYLGEIPKSYALSL